MDKIGSLKKKKKTKTQTEKDRNETKVCGMWGNEEETRDHGGLRDTTRDHRIQEVI